MYCRVRHFTRYHYARAVFLEPHVLRLTPRGDAAQHLLSQTVTIHPEPVGISPCTDLFGNRVLTIWFAEMTDHLEIEVACEVETLRSNPFDFLPDPERSRLPVPLTATEAAMTALCLAPVPGAQDDARALAARLMAEGADTPQDFLWALVTWMGRTLRPIIRHEPGILEPDTLLARGEGACRDLSVCAMAACRAVGIPTRFVSGYQEGDPDRGDWDLHAWFEAWLPGGGWRGYDPTYGLTVADRHITLAAAPDPGDAAPVQGHFRGEASVALSHVVQLAMA